MPFTPFHLGPGLAVKAAIGKRFSLLCFAAAQVLIDVEPLVGLLRGAAVLHGHSHSYVGASLIGLLVMLLARPTSRLVAGLWNRQLTRRGCRRLQISGPVGLLPATTGAFVGSYSHVVLDSVMHRDMTPLWPWSAANALLGLIPLGQLHLLCVLAGMVGLLAWSLLRLADGHRPRD